jgi:hypothetical protein
MKLFNTIEFPGDLGRHSDPHGQECSGRLFTAKSVGVGGVYVNEVECTTCERVLPAVEDRLLPIHSMTTWHVQKTGDDQFHVHGGDQFTRIEEDVDGPKLMGMLTGKGLSTEQAMSVAFDLDSKGIGFHTTIAFRPASFGDAAQR